MLTRSDKVGEAEIEYKEVSQLRGVLFAACLNVPCSSTKMQFDAVEGRE